MEFKISKNNDRMKKCPICGFQTLPSEEDSHWVCEVCYWEDDEIENENPDKNMGGANSEALNDYRAKWLKEHHRQV